MTTAVLKNRLLDLTDRSFDEAHWGASSFMNFVSHYPDMLQVDESAFPPVVELYGTEADRLASEGDEYTPIVYHIRSDLWQAALDYSSGVQYVWDRDTKRARLRHGLETVPIIDTVTADLQRQWRHEFRDLMTDSLELTDVELDQTDEWIRLQLGTYRLPNQLIPEWNRFFRDKVRDHLRGWFSDSSLEPPDDMVSSAHRRETGDSSETEELRELVVSVVRKMTHEELSRINLPSEAVLRASRRL